MFSGPVAINAGTLKIGSYAALGTTSGITVTAGATLDVGGITALNAGGGITAAVTISGAGVNGLGALTNSGTVGQQNAFQNVTLATDATVGADSHGTGGPPNFSSRFDIRGGSALLNLNGHSLTKAGTNEVRIAGGMVNAGSIIVNQGIFTLEGSTSTDVGTNITVNSNTILQFSAASGTIAGPIVLNGTGVTVNDATAAAGTSTVVANITLQGNATFNGPATSNLILSGMLTESGGARSITKTGTSTLTLGNTSTLTPNSYSGGTNMNGGVVNFAALSSLGTGPLLFNGGTLQYGSGVTDDVSILPISLNVSGGTIDSNFNTISLAHNIIGAGGLTLKGNGIITLSGTNTYAGPTTIQNGTVVLGSGGAIPANTALLMGSTANESPTLDLSGRSITVSALSRVGTGAPMIGSSSTTTPSTLTFAGNSATPSTFGGTIQDTGPTGGTQQTALTVNSGSLTLNGFNNYTGTTRVNGGTLTLDAGGSLASTSPLTLGGGTFATTGVGLFQQLGTLNMTASSTIDFGTGAAGGILHFTTAAPTWTGTLTIGHWTGSSPNPLLGGGVDQLYVDSNSLTVAQKNAIKFDGFPAGAQVLGTNEIVPSQLGYLPGDFNKSGALDTGDLTTMLSALTDLNVFATANGYTPGDLLVIGDLDGSGALNNKDIQSELDLLASAGLGSVTSVPEPGSIVLSAMCGIALLAIRRAKLSPLPFSHIPRDVALPPHIK